MRPVTPGREAVQRAGQRELRIDATRRESGAPARLELAGVGHEIVEPQIRAGDGDVRRCCHRLAGHLAFDHGMAAIDIANRSQSERDYRLFDGDAACSECRELRGCGESGTCDAACEAAGGVDRASDLGRADGQRTARGGFEGKIGFAAHHTARRAGAQLGAVEACVLNGDAAVLVGQARIQPWSGAQQLRHDDGRAGDVCACAIDCNRPHVLLGAGRECAPASARFAAQIRRQRLDSDQAPIAGELAVAVVHPALRIDEDRVANDCAAVELEAMLTAIIIHGRCYARIGEEGGRSLAVREDRTRG